MPTDRYHELYGWTEEEEKEERRDAIITLGTLVTMRFVFVLVCFVR